MLRSISKKSLFLNSYAELSLSLSIATKFINLSCFSASTLHYLEIGWVFFPPAKVGYCITVPLPDYFSFCSWYSWSGGCETLWFFHALIWYILILKKEKKAKESNHLEVHEGGRLNQTLTVVFNALFMRTWFSKTYNVDAWPELSWWKMKVTTFFLLKSHKTIPIDHMIVL